MRSCRSFANDNHHVMAKHSSVYPAPEELEAIQTLVSTVEGALKKVSDWMDGLKTSSGKTPSCNNTVEEDAPEMESDSTSVLCGVTRVGLVAKGLLIKGDMNLELVLMCREKPTKHLLYTISANLPLQIQAARCCSVDREPEREALFINTNLSCSMGVVTRMCPPPPAKQQENLQPQM
ncbi:hypothetical protein AMECASPLE_030904 [Ameca splendens]|uniref:DZF domain-containing protein n=1 Tax=Ameca splendens TaxID=208324 RepID=A0ABV0ZR16_9TELE